MANWQRNLRLWPEWDQASEGEITVHELATVIAERLRGLKDFGGIHQSIDEDRIYLAEEFEDLSNDKDADTSDFDELMERLYDWADIQIGGKFFDAKKVCWIDRMPPRASLTTLESPDA